MRHHFPFFKTRIAIALIAGITAGTAVDGLAQTPTLKWEYRYNGPGNQADRFNDLKVDGSLNAYVTGSSMGLTSNIDYVTAKVDNDGNQVWAERYNGPGNGIDEAYRLVMDNAGAVYLTGKSLGDGTGFDWATIKYNNNGVQQWLTRYTYPAVVSANEIPAAIVINSANDAVFVTGTGIQSQQFPNNPVVRVRRFDAANGNMTALGDNWSIEAEPTTLLIDNTSTGVYVGSEKNAGGSTTQMMFWKFGGFSTLSVDYPNPQISSVVHRPNGGVLDASMSNVYFYGYRDIITGSTSQNLQATVLKFNSQLVYQWADVPEFGGAGTGRDEALDAKEYNGDLYVVGYADMDASAGVNNDFLIAKINGSTGAVIWQREYDRGSDDRAFKVHVSSLGNIYVVGQTVNPSGNKDITLLMYNNSGQLQWERHYNGPGNGDDIPTGLHVSLDANDITISGVSVGSGSQNDGIVLRYCVPPIPDAGPDKGFCSGGSTTIGTTALPNHTYLWTPATGLSSATVAQPTLTLTNTTNCPVNHQYIVKVTRQGGCFDYDTVNVTVYHNPVVSIAASSPNPVCFGGTVTLSPTINTGCSGTPAYSWRLGSQQVSTSASAYSVSQVNQSGSYTLTVTNNHGGTSCATTSNAVNATVNSLPVGSASSVNLCSGGTTGIALNSSIAGTSFAWTSAVTSGSVSGHFSGSGGTIQQTLSGAGTVTYTVTPTVTATGCVGQAFTVTATVAASLPQPEVTASGPLQFCSGGSVTLTAPAGYTYQWSCGGSGQSIILSQSATCTVTVTQGNCTATSAATQVVAMPLPTANAGADQTITPPNTSVQLSGSASGGSGSGYQYSWSPTTGLSSPNSASTTASPTENTTYTLTVTDGNGCIGTDNVTVTLGPEIPPCNNSTWSAAQGSMVIPNSGGGPYTLDVNFAPAQTGCTWSLATEGDCDWIENLQPSTPQLSGGEISFNAIPNATETTRTCSLMVTVGEVSYPPILVNQQGGYTSINEAGVQIEGITIYPNPTNGQFDILVLSLQGQLRYEVFSPIGQSVHSGSITSDRTSINVQGAAAGIYLLRVTDASGQMMGLRRVVVQ